MVTVEEKLNIFSKLVFEKVKNECDMKLKIMRDENKKIIEDYKAKKEKEGKDIIEKKIKSGEQKKKQLISKAKNETKRKILSKKNELLDKLTDEVKEKVKQYTEHNVYEEFLNETLNKILIDFKNENKIVLYMTENDINKYKSKVISFFNYKKYNGIFEIKVDKEDIIGGIRAVNGKNTVRIDLSLLAIIKDNKRYIGQILFQELEKESD
ncbi:V-type ATP synthase subunit E [Caldisalinibacter kiritimatiensis]|uniref:V-type ATP synthase subunit E n=1 Tax=Caldisalinibacter kiritimatiensis TaxID=1304284 RepID=R1AW12_9FIRM|nr:V-type ATP synthase subunit E family protein [Caldisalinibacter kiritimatiensis]EOD01368.1 hypothetical protein L21TH_0589 [Caldisalinibacter kiritimatiensis]